MLVKGSLYEAKIIFLLFFYKGVDPTGHFYFLL